MRALASLIAALVAMISSESFAADSPSPSVAAMDHIAISVTDADKSAAFYSGVFGFKQVPAPVPMARWLVMANGVMLHIVGNRKTLLNIAAGITLRWRAPIWTRSFQD